MLALFAYLLIAFISAYCFTPKNKTALWVYALLIPLTVSALYLFYLYGTTSGGIFRKASYLVGKKFASCVIPTIICGVIIYFQLRKKMNHEGKVKFPKILFAFIIIALGLGLYQNYLEEEVRKGMEELQPQLQEIREKEIALNDLRETTRYMKNRLPMSAGGGSIIYDIKFDEDKKKFTYYYKETEIDKSELTQEGIDVIKNTLRSQLLKTLQNNPDNKHFVKAGITMIFDYSDKNGEHLLSFTVSPDEYK